MTALLHTDLPGLPLLSRGKVRDVYATSSPDHLLFIATDRISVYDIILNSGIPDKGKLLTSISLFWFRKLSHIIPNHLVTVNVDEMPEEVRQHRKQLEGRTMLVRKARVVPIEAIVRGYITGSAWAEYQKSQTVCGIPIPEKMEESQKFQTPIFTPSTKAEQGTHDENISLEKAAQLIGQELIHRIQTVSLQLYAAATEYAESCGLILADTKFEFGLIPSPDGQDELIIVDEVLTPDSSRYWPRDQYEPGKGQPSFDKQYVRNALTTAGYRKGLESGPNGNGEGWGIDDTVIEGTRERYKEAEQMLKSPRS